MIGMSVDTGKEIRIDIRFVHQNIYYSLWSIWNCCVLTVGGIYCLFIQTMLACLFSRAIVEVGMLCQDPDLVNLVSSFGDPAPLLSSPVAVPRPLLSPSSHLSAPLPSIPLI